MRCCLDYLALRSRGVKYWCTTCMLGTEVRAHHPLLRDLHYVRVPQRIEFKLVFRCMHGRTPQYVARELRCMANIDTRRQLYVLRRRQWLMYTDSTLATMPSTSLPLTSATVPSTSLPSVLVLYDMSRKQLPYAMFAKIDFCLIKAARRKNVICRQAYTGCGKK